MARLIKETPMLYGEEARLFELRAATVKPLSKEDADADTRLLYFDLKQLEA